MRGFRRGAAVAGMAAVILEAAVLPAASIERVVTIAAAGDIMMGSNYPHDGLPPDGGAGLFAAVAPILRAADIAFGNLEGTLTTSGSSTKDVSSGRAYAFRTPPGYAAHLVAAGFDVMSLANNHIEDFGAEGVVATEAALGGHGIAFAGKRGPVPVVHVRGVAIGFIGADTYGGARNIVDPAPLLAEIAAVATTVDILVVSVHAGAEGAGALHIRDATEIFYGENRGNLVGFSRDAVEAGADLVLGHGPHVPRGMEIHEGRLIAYSLGNFCNYRGFNLTGPMGLAPLLEVHLAADGRLLGGTVHSFRQTPPGGPVADPEATAAHLMASLSREDFPASAPVFDGDGRFSPPVDDTPLVALPAEVIVARNEGRRRRPRAALR